MKSGKRAAKAPPASLQDDEVPGPSVLPTAAVGCEVLRCAELGALPLRTAGQVMAAVTSERLHNLSRHSSSLRRPVVIEYREGRCGTSLARS